MLPDGFTKRMQTLLGADFDAFAASYDRPRSVGLRLNPLKTDAPPALAQFGLSPVPRSSWPSALLSKTAFTMTALRVRDSARITTRGFITCKSRVRWLRRGF